VPNPGSNQTTNDRPVCDEWGVYDPEQAGFEAIVRRLLPDEGYDAKRTQASSLPHERSGVHSPAVTT
jgi:hypothetical protein